MPTYEFRCPEGHDFEKFYRSIGAGPRELPCPVCGKIAERQMSAGAGLVFKGSGFYITDYGKDGKKPQATSAPESGTSGSEPSSKGESAKESSTGSSDVKPAKESKPATSAPAEKPASGKKKSQDE